MEKIFEQIKGYRDDVIHLQSELTCRIALGPENGGTGEHEKSDFVKGLLAEMAPDFLEQINAPDERARDGFRPNLIAKWDGVLEGPTVWVLSHLDVVPSGDKSLWDNDPFKVRVDGDRIIGRGVEDNQHGFVSSFLALKAILESGEKPKRPVGLAIVADEESGSRYGLQYVLEHGRALFKEDDLIIVPDGGSEDGTMVEVAEKAMLWVKFIILGRQCHGSTPEKGKNSLLGAARLILALEKLNEIFSRTDGLYKPHCSTFAPTKIEANVPNVNTIPGRDVFYLDCRILPVYPVDEVLMEIRKIVSEIESGYGLEIEVSTFHREDAANPTSPDAPVVHALGRAIKSICKKEAVPVGIGGGTVAAFFRKAGLPAAVWCTQCDTAHQPNEYALISDILTDARIFAYLYMGVDDVL